MKTRKTQAATFFGFTILGFALCVALAFVASDSDSKALSKGPAIKPEVPSSKAKPSPSQSLEETSPEPTEAPAAFALDPASVQKGKQNYDMFCLACHGAENAGIDSPSNLFDSKWYHGSGRGGIELSIKNGIMEKGMPGWGAMIPAEDITALADYLLSFQNRNL